MVWWTEFDKNAANVKQDLLKPANNLDHIKRSLTERFSSGHYLNVNPVITRLTPIFVTLGTTCNTMVEVKNLIESGMNIAHLALSPSTHEDSMLRLKVLRAAAQSCCEKYSVNVWPVAVAVALCSGVKRSGLVTVSDEFVFIKQGTQVTVTNDESQWDKCSENLIYVDYSHLTQDVKVGNKIIIQKDEIILVCIEIINNKEILCAVKQGGQLHSMRIVTLKEAKHTAPNLTKKDLHHINFAVEHKLDILIIPYVRSAQVLIDIRKILKEKSYSLDLIASICTEEGLENLQDILQECDGIILAREYLSYELESLKYRIVSVQKHVAAQCKKAGKPMIISGILMDSVREDNALKYHDLFDISNAIMDGVGGFLLKDYGQDFKTLYDDMMAICSICKNVEPIINLQDEFWRQHLEVPMPLNAAEACAVSCLFVASYTESAAILIMTSSGETVKLVAAQRPSIPVIATTANKAVARRLNLYRGVIPYVYTDPTSKSFKQELDNRIDATLMFLVNKGILTTGQLVVVLSRSTQYTAYCNMLQTVRVSFRKMLLWDNCEENEETNKRIR